MYIATVNNFLQDKKISFRIITSQKKGAGAARNLGIYHSKCEWIAFLDSDDIWLEDKLSTISQLIECNRDSNFICHAEDIIGLDKKTHSQKSTLINQNKALTNQLYFKNLFSTSAVVVKRSFLLECGVFDEGLKNAQDYDLWLKLGPGIKLVFCREVLGKYILRPDSISTGPLINRYKNLFKIAWRYRKYTNQFGVLYKFLQISARFFKTAISGHLR